MAIATLLDPPNALFFDIDGFSRPDDGFSRPGACSNARPVGEMRDRRAVEEVAVCVPARNEARRLPAFLEAMEASVEQARAAGVGVRLVVALDGCTDASEALLARARVTFPCPIVITRLPALGISHAGRARRAAMETGLSQLADRVAETCEAEVGSALLTTDADTQVDADWIAASARALAASDVVAGYVEWDDETPVPELARQERYFDALHRWRRRIDPVAFDAPNPHHKQYGASLAIRNEAYSRLGGLPERRASEDVELCRRARLAGMRVRQDRNVRVTTSTRRTGRARGGFSDAILSVEGTRGRPLHVDCPDAWTALYRASATLRAAFEMGRPDARDLEDLGTELSDDELKQAWAVSPSADAYVTRLLDPVPGACGPRTPEVPKVPLEVAIARLETMTGERI